MLKSVLLASATSLVVFASAAVAQTVPATGSQERVWSAGAEKVGALTSRAWAARGTGVTIAIVDSGIRADHKEFTGALVGGYNAFTGATGLGAVGDTQGHGTHVASLAAARANGTGMVGVASNARILAVKVFQGSSSSDAVIANGIRYATTKGAFVVNLSLGGGQSTAIRNALQGAVTAGQVVVVAAGNEGAANPSWPARHASEAWANGQIIAVGAVDSRNMLASFSNRAGDAKNFYLVAPGVSLIGAHNSSPNTYAMMSGTSMAAPLVTGAAAVVKSAWPYLSARNVANILFLTATDLGAKGVDEVYGRGLLNLERAMLPFGSITAVGAAGSTPLALAASKSSVTLGAMGAAQRSGALTGAVFDSLGRDFAYDFGRAQLSTRADTLTLLSTSVDRRIASLAVSDQNGGTTLLGFAPSADDERLDQMSVAYLQADGSGWAATQGAASPLLDTIAAPRAGLAPTTAGFASASSILDRTASSVAFRAGFGSSDSLTFGVSHQDSHYFGETLLAPAREIDDATSVHIGVQRQLARLALNLDVSLLEETGSRLGEPSGSLFGVSGDARTLSAQLGAALALTDRLTLAAQASTARTAAQDGRENGLVTRMSDTASLAYALTLAAADTFAPGDRITLAVGQPMMSQSGAMDLALATGADPASGEPLLARRRVSLATENPELRLEMDYARQLGPMRLALAAMSRLDADGEAGRHVHAFLVKASTKF